ncbi:MAG: methyltransferase domain-containing protein [Verrucomicrobiales bacterium]|nr:methyltransferase domain-containing protein [Verrucomicrobiales bacterium]
MGSNLGTYNYGEFSNNADELERLKRQAKVAWSIEEGYLAAHGLKDGITVADLACGPGIISGLIKSEICPASKVIGVELNESLLALARTLTADKEDPPEFRAGDVYQLDCLEDESIDFAYCRFLLQHLAEPARALQTVYRKLKPGGRVAILETDDSLFSFMPAIADMDRFIETAIAAQDRLGGDRKIGRKLAGLLWENNFTDSLTQVVTINTEMMDGNEFLNITTSFKLELIPEDEMNWARACIDNARKAIKSGAYFGQAGVYMVSASRPK